MASIPNPVESIDSSNFFTDVQSQLFSIVKNGNGFQNPLKGIISSVTSAATTTISTLEGLVSTPPSGFTGLGLQEINSDLEDLLEKNAEFNLHTNLLSGVDQSRNQATANLSQLTSVGLQSVALDNFLNTSLGNPCGKLLNLFGALFLGPELMNTVNQYVQSIVGLVNNGQATAQDIQSQIQQYITQIDNMIANDRFYYESLFGDLINAALARNLESIFQSDCGRFLLSETIGSTDLITVLRKGG